MKEIRNTNYFPVLISLNKFPCLVVGGGTVAYRKTLSLLAFNACITVLSPQTCKPFLSLAEENKIKIIRGSYTKKYIKNFKMVFCATNNKKINQTVYEDCAKEGILLNVADAPALCDFILPANVKRGDLTVSISSQGTAPFYTKEIKEKVGRFLSPEYTEIIKLAGLFRDRLMKNPKTKSSKTKAKMFKKFTAIDWETYLRENGPRNSYKQFQKLLNEIN